MRPTTIFASDRDARTVPLTDQFAEFLKRYGLRSPYVLQPDVTHGTHRVLFCGFHAGMRKLEIVEAVPEWFNLLRRTVEIRATATFRPKALTIQSTSRETKACQRSKPRTSSRELHFRCQDLKGWKLSSWLEALFEVAVNIGLTAALVVVTRCRFKIVQDSQTDPSAPQGFNLIFEASGKSLNGVPVTITSRDIPDITAEVIADLGGKEE